MAENIDCVRCGRNAPALPRPPVPGDLGHEIQAKVCAECWREWQRVEVMVINELKLNFMDPRSQEILDQQMRDFLALNAPSAPGRPSPPPSS